MSFCLLLRTDEGPTKSKKVVFPSIPHSKVKLRPAHQNPSHVDLIQIFDELGYLALPPCIWGPEDEGLMPPTFLSFDTNLMSIKRNNNTNGHYGEMASWQMRGILVKNDQWIFFSVNWSLLSDVEIYFEINY